MIETVECVGGPRCGDVLKMLPGHDRCFVTVRRNTYACHCLSEVPAGIRSELIGVYFREPKGVARWYECPDLAEGGFTQGG